MRCLRTNAPITAVVYSDGAVAAGILESASRALLDAGYVCAGFVQRDLPRPGRSRCDMILLNIATGLRVQISEDRGPGARGCHLDPHVLLVAMAEATADLTEQTSILIINKFGKSEGEGGGFRPLIVEALDRDIPVLIGVPWRNIDSWREFAGAFSTEIEVEFISQRHSVPLLSLLSIRSEEMSDIEAAPSHLIIGERHNV